MPLTYAPMTASPSPVTLGKSVELTILVAADPHPTTVDVTWTIAAGSGFAFSHGGMSTKQLRARGVPVDTEPTAVTHNATIVSTGGVPPASVEVRAQVVERNNADSFPTNCWVSLKAPPAATNKSLLAPAAPKAAARRHRSVLPHSSTDVVCPTCGARLSATGAARKDAGTRRSGAKSAALATPKAARGRGAATETEVSTAVTAVGKKPGAAATRKQGAPRGQR